MHMASKCLSGLKHMASVCLSGLKHRVFGGKSSEPDAPLAAHISSLWEETQSEQIAACGPRHVAGLAEMCPLAVCRSS